MFSWYVVNTYSGHENKVRQNILHRAETMGQVEKIRRVVVPTEMQIETKNGQKVEVSKRTLPGYVLVWMVDPRADGDAWRVVKDTPGVTGFVGGQAPVPLSQAEVDKILHTQTQAAAKPRATAAFTLGEMVKVVSGPLSDFDGEIVEVNEDAQRLKVSVSIFERQVPVDLEFEQVKKLD